MRKNTASQVIGAQMVSATDGSAFTSAVTCYVTGDGGTQAIGSVGSGACTHEGNGFHSYAPAQAETNYDHVAFTFIGTGAVPATVQVYPSYPQTGDAYARLGAPAGASVSADVAAVKAETASILADTAEIGTNGQGLTALASASNLATLTNYVDTEVAAIKASTDALTVKKNTALAGFTFPMYDDGDHVTPLTGLTVTAERSIDGAAYSACANAVSEIGTTGRYKIDLAAADLNGAVIALKFTATGADPVDYTILTQP